MRRGPDHLHRWIYYLTAGFLFAACVLRSLLLLDSPSRTPTLILLLAWFALFVTEERLSPRWRAWFAAYLAIQSVLTALLLSGSDSADFFAILFAILGMQAMQRYPPRWGAAVVGAFVPVMALPMLATYEASQALIFLVIYGAAAGLVASYSLATRRAAEAAADNQAMVAELEGANRQMRAYSVQLQQGAVTRERHRLAHDLHDSVTQTIFSMTLTTQSAVLLLQQDPARVQAQLDRLAQLTRGALSEMQLLISELRPEKRLEDGLIASLERYLAERASPQEVSVAVEVEGEGALSAVEEQTLFRIAQEAINNVIKHARASTTTICLHRSPPFRLEIRDPGQGFDPVNADSRKGFGLASMRERAAEIGWSFDVISSPGAGTRVVVEKRQREG